MALTSEQIEGSQLRLGPPVGALTLDGTCGRDLLLVAGSTGLAPLKAILEQVAALDDPPQVDLFFGAATAEGLYDLDALDKLAARHPWLALTPVITGGPAAADPGFAGQTGTLPEVVARSGDWSAARGLPGRPQRHGPGNRDPARFGGPGPRAHSR